MENQTEERKEHAMDTWRINTGAYGNNYQDHGLYVWDTLNPKPYRVPRIGLKMICTNKFPFAGAYSEKCTYIWDPRGHMGTI